MLKPYHSFFLSLRFSAAESVTWGSTGKKQSLGFIDGQAHVQCLNANISRKKEIREHRQIPRSEWGLLPADPKSNSWDGHAHLWEESYVTRSLEQTWSPQTPPVMWARMASPCFPVAGKAETWLTDMQWPHSLARCDPVIIKLWPVGLPTIKGVQKCLEAPCVARGALWGILSLGFGREDLPWHLAQRRCLRMSPLEAEPETGIQMHMTHGRNVLRRSLQGRRGRRRGKERSPGRIEFEVKFSLGLIHRGLWSTNYTAELTCLGARGWHSVYLGPFTDRSSCQIGALFSSPPFCNRFPRERQWNDFCHKQKRRFLKYGLIFTKASLVVSLMRVWRRVVKV